MRTVDSIVWNVWRHPENRTSRLLDVTANTPALRVLVYSDDSDVRSQVILGLGRRVHPDFPELQYVEVATEPVVWQQLDSGTIDLAILDGEATPAGGLGIARQMKDEIYQAPPALTLHTADAALRLEQQGFNEWVVWNPGAADAAALADLADDEYLRFVCIEPARVDQQTLAAGAEWTGRHRIVCAPRG